MSQVFDDGVWLPSSSWRVYSKLSSIVLPGKTWVLVDEHPDSINDAACAVQMAKPGDPPGSIMIIDWPASFHNGACGLSFADGHSEIHKWKGSKLRAPATYGTYLGYLIPAGDSANDIIWWSSVTTVAK